MEKCLRILLILFISQMGFAQGINGIRSLGNTNSPNGINEPGRNANNFPMEGQEGEEDALDGRSGRAALDDSTKQIYSPKTVYYFHQEDWLHSENPKNRIDTTLDMFHRYLVIEKKNFLSTDLGNQGTALRSLYIQPNRALGTQLGYQAYRPFGFDSDSVRYYNTKSPFSIMHYDMGAGGQSRLNFTFNRNVDSLWNIGLELQRINSKKNLIDGLFQQGDRSLINHWSILFHSNFTSKNGKYRLLTNLNFFNQGTREQGGVELLAGLTPSQALQYTDNAAVLTNGLTENYDRDFTAHYYHEFIGWKGLQFYQKIQLKSQSARFKDNDFVNTLAQGIYPRTYIIYIQAPTRDSLYNEIQWKEFSHQTGIKGYYKKFNYLAYFKQRYWNAHNPVENASKNRLENYIGLNLEQKIGEKIDFKANGEYLLGRDYLINGQLNTPFGFVEVKRMNFSPTLKDNWVYNTSFRWENDYRNILMDELKGGIRISSSNLTFTPSISLQRIDNFIYYDSLATALQTKKAISVIRPSLDLKLYPGKFLFWVNAYWNNQFGPDVFRTPEFVVQGTTSIDLNYKTNLYTRLGIDYHYYSSYYAPAYQMALQAYHLQNDYRVPSFIQLDPYLSLRINYVRVYLKYANALQGVLTKNHYTAYLYQAMPRGFALGVVWQLFD